MSFKIFWENLKWICFRSSKYSFVFGNQGMTFCGCNVKCILDNGEVKVDFYKLLFNLFDLQLVFFQI